MTHKEEAIKRVDEMLYKSPTIQDGISAIDTLYAKQCALLAIDREIKMCQSFASKQSDYKLLERLKKVKQEIELL